ncbi:MULTISPECIES: aconitate hydratase AcnA [unclassified Achromobacter]|uniref:aconitate hydratase AcnA n=1 Tax=unclassified Achromobacter TaxID=2626865 RepID=UPI000B516C72|nr:MULTISPECIES: aconitate hydratase AcnA [unclassified Achromobacter]OWT80322.1 aconitate hydratase 1 [Achromobacter sp. HZ34]OWT82205.1 aconitate hydratase 1 [Achromobacter sp. HZ28]
MKFRAADALRPLSIAGQPAARYYALGALEEMGFGAISRLPHSIRIILESVLRNLDGVSVQESHLRELAAWQPKAERNSEIPFVVSRIVAPDSSGVPLLADLAAMREAAAEAGMDPAAIEPLVPVDLIVDHSISVEHAGSGNALARNMAVEYERNGERYSFLKWAANAFSAFRIFPPGTGIIHQINLELLARGVHQKDGIAYFDSLVGTDSHTPMINGIGVVGWGVGGIEAEAAMLGQPIYVVAPDVVGVELVGTPRPGILATDIVLTVVQALRAKKVVGKFVEFFGAGVSALAAVDRATIANMAPEYGATLVLFPVDERTLDYLHSVGRKESELAALAAYFKAQDMFGVPAAGAIDYSDTLRIDLGAVEPSVAGPSRPQDRIALADLKHSVRQLLEAKGGTGSPATPATALRDGDVVLAAITSCTNTSNYRSILAAGVLARNAVRKGLRAAPHVKTSFTPGSRAVTEYLKAAGLDTPLDALGFQVAGYGCATCMGNSGPLAPEIADEIKQGDLTVAAVLSGNRNFEARIHQAIKANYLMSPPLVVAFAIAGTSAFDPAADALGTGADGAPVYLRDIWPTDAEMAEMLPYALDPGNVLRVYAKPSANPLWEALDAPAGDLFTWQQGSTYLKRPPFFDGVTRELPAQPAIRGARALAILGDSVTTDHINPGGSIPAESESGQYLISLGVAPADFNSYISRRAHDDVMVRSTFANVRVRNLMVPEIGSKTLHQPDGTPMSIFAAATKYAEQGVPMIVFAGEEYGNGSSRDWAAKGPRLLGIRAVIARSFERIHRSNLVGMGILPLEFVDGQNAQALGLTGDETFDLPGDLADIQVGQSMQLVIHRKDGTTQTVPLRARIDSAIEAAYFLHGGILPYVLRNRLEQQTEA